MGWQGSRTAAWTMRALRPPGRTWEAVSQSSNPTQSFGPFTSELAEFGVEPRYYSLMTSQSYALPESRPSNAPHGMKPTPLPRSTVNSATFDLATARQTVPNQCGG